MTDRFEELLPWFVNGSLGAEDRDWVERYLVAHPEANAELAWYRSLQSRIKDGAPAVPDTIGLAQAMARIAADRPGLAQRLTAFLGTLGMRPAAAFAASAIFAVQGAFILNLLDSARDNGVEIRALRPALADERPMLKINFAADAKEAEIRLLLMSVQGRLAGGPGQLGDYYVVVPAGKEVALAEQLKAHPIVQAVVVAPGLPLRD